MNGFRSVWATVVVMTLGGPAMATECGKLRLEAAHWKAAQPTTKDAAGQLRAVEKKLQAACAPVRVSVAAIPLAYVPVPLGNLSRAGLDLPAGPGPTFSTRAGAPAGIVFADSVTLDQPAIHLETELSPNRSVADVLVAIATDVKLTVEEPQAGHGVWKLESAGEPVLMPLSKIRACASGKDKTAKLLAAVCQSLLVVDPSPGTDAIPERGRAVPLGEWQWGWRATIDLVPDSLGVVPNAKLPVRVPMRFELSAPIPGVSDGKRLDVTLENHARVAPEGLSWKLGHGCGDDDVACEKTRFDGEVWFDRAFGVAFLRAPNTPSKTGSLVGKVTDRLARAIGGQRVVATVGGRRAITITDKDGEFRFEGLPAGETVVVPVGRDPANIAKGDEKRQVLLGTAEVKVPVIFVNKLFE